MTEQEIIRAQIKALTIFEANNKCMSVDECARYLGVYHKTVTNKIHSGDIKATLIGRVWSIPKLQFMDQLIEEV